MASSITHSSSASSLEHEDAEKRNHARPKPDSTGMPPPVEPLEAHADDLTEQKDPEKTDEPLPLSDPSQFPDGGLKAWSVVFGGFCCLFISFGWINCIGVFQDYYQTHQLAHLSPSTVSWISSLEAFMMFAGGPIIGRIIDDFGPRYTLLVGSILHVFGLLMVSLSSQYYQFILAQGICSAMGASCIFYAGMTSVGTWFMKNRATAFGIMTSGSSLGGVIFPIMVSRLVPSIGFGWTMRVCAFMILGLAIIANLTVSSRLKPQRKPLILKEFVTPLKEAPYTLVVIASFFFAWGLFLPFNFLSLQAQAAGMSTNLSGYVIPVLNATSIFGRIIPGIIADRIGRFNATTLMTFFSSILILALWIPSSSNATILVFASLYGFGSGAFVSLAPSLIAQISDIRKLGVRTGTMFAIISIAVLTGNPIGGAILTKWNGDFTGLQIFCGVVTFAGSTVFLISRIQQTGAKLNAII